jgi:YgiT-type zinc finger domain-containing protein
MKCTKCYKGDLTVDVTSLTYTREGSAIQVQVKGIPAEICPICGEVYLSEAVAQQIFDLVDPLLEVGKKLYETILPPPTVEIQFPPLTPAHLKRVFAVSVA